MKLDLLREKLEEVNLDICLKLYDTSYKPKYLNPKAIFPLVIKR